MKTRIQTKTVTVTGAGASVHTSQMVVLDNNYPYCVGMAVIDENINSIANSTNVQIGIEDNDHTIFDFVPIEVWQQTQNVSKRKMFRHCQFRAGGNQVQLKVKADDLAVGDVCTFDVVFLLSDSAPGNLDKNFQVQKIQVDALTSANMYETMFDLRSDYKEVTALGIVCDNPEDFFVRIDDASQIYINDVRGNFLAIDPDSSYYDRFLKTRIAAPGQSLNVRVKNAGTLPSGKDTFYLILQVEN